MIRIFKNNSMMAQQPYHRIENFKAEHLFFTDILKELHCGMANKVDFSNEKYINEKRMKRGVMENIVTAYSDIFTKG